MVCEKAEARVNERTLLIMRTRWALPKKLRREQRPTKGHWLLLRRRSQEGTPPGEQLLCRQRGRLAANGFQAWHKHREIVADIVFVCSARNFCYHLISGWCSSNSRSREFWSLGFLCLDLSHSSTSASMIRRECRGGLGFPPIH